MSHLDSYDELTKWHLFAFRADVERLAEFRAALAQWISYRDVAPMRAFAARYAAQYQRERTATTVHTDRALLTAISDFAAAAGLDPRDVSARIAGVGPELQRDVVARLQTIPHRAHRLARLRQVSAPDEVVANELFELRAAFAAAGLAAAPVPPPDHGDVPIEVAQWPPRDEFRYLFERGIELVVRDPYAANIGYGRLFGLFDDMIVPAGAGLVDSEWPVHYENADGSAPCVYGFDGFEISILDGSDRDDLVAFDLTQAEIRTAAINYVSDQLVDEGEDRDGDRDVERRFGDRVAFMCRQLGAEWHRVKTSLLAALDDVRAKRSAVLAWSAKNPSL